MSTKGRYGLIIMIDLAHAGDYLSIHDIAEKEDMSEKYLGKIMALLSKAKLVSSTHGKNGGYKLKYQPKDYKIGDILRVAEGNMDVTDCVSKEHICPNSHHCQTFPLWMELNNVINDYLDSKTLADYI